MISGGRDAAPPPSVQLCLNSQTVEANTIYKQGREKFQYIHGKKIVDPRRKGFVLFNRVHIEPWSPGQNFPAFIFRMAKKYYSFFKADGNDDSLLTG